MTIDFEPTAEQRANAERLRRFAVEWMVPAAIDLDAREHERPTEVIEKIQALANEGVPGFRRHANPDAVSSVLYTEALAYGAGSILLSFPGPQLAGAAIMASGTDAQKKKWLARYADGKVRFGAMAVTEPGCGSDVAAIQTTAALDGDHWVLNGTKIFCTNGASADLVVVWATTDPALGRRGIRAFVVEKGTPGMKVGRLEKKLGIRASETAELVFEDCKIPKDAVLGGEGEKPSDFKGVMATFDATRPGVAAMAVGIAQAAVDHLALCLAREEWPGAQYGRLRTRLAAVDDAFLWMEGEIEASRRLVHRAAWMLDKRQPNGVEAAMAKAKAGRMVVEVTAKVVELLGPIGITREHPAEMWLRDSKVFDIFEGTGQINRLVIARRILGYSRDELR